MHKQILRELQREAPAIGPLRPYRREELHLPAEVLAPRLLGDVLVRCVFDADGRRRDLTAGRIVETEAYLGADDAASHAAAASSKRNALFYEPGGIAYVFRSYGLHHCFNVIVDRTGRAGCVLVRALEPLAGIETMARRRGRNARELRSLCSGPGKLCEAMEIDMSCNGRDLTAGELVLLAGPSCGEVARGRRIGIRRAAERPLRFCCAASPHLSRPCR